MDTSISLKTLELKKLQQPSHVDNLLHQFVQHTGTLSEDARPLRERGKLPSVLQRLIVLAASSGKSWSAWMDENHVVLFVSEMSLPVSRERGAPVFQIDQYENGEMKHTGKWLVDREDLWWRCAD